MYLDNKYIYGVSCGNQNCYSCVRMKGKCSTLEELDEYPATWIMINMDLYDELGSILDNENIQWKW